MSARQLLPFIALALVACGGDQQSDLRSWMDDQGKNARGNIEKPPQLRAHEPFVYNAFDLDDPFKPRKIEPARGVSKLAPDLMRRKEALEAFPIENLKMVGTMQQNATIFALVRANDGRLFQVRRGNYIGQNFGVVTSINEAELSLKELIQDASGDWSERQTRLPLLDAPEKTEKGKKP